MTKTTFHWSLPPRLVDTGGPPESSHGADARDEARRSPRAMTGWSEGESGAVPSPARTSGARPLRAGEDRRAPLAGAHGRLKAMGLSALSGQGAPSRARLPTFMGKQHIEWGWGRNPRFRLPQSESSREPSRSWDRAASWRPNLPILPPFAFFPSPSRRSRAACVVLPQLSDILIDCFRPLLALAKRSSTRFSQQSLRFSSRSTSISSLGRIRYVAQLNAPTPTRINLNFKPSIPF